MTNRLQKEQIDAFLNNEEDENEPESQMQVSIDNSEKTKKISGSKNKKHLQRSLSKQTTNNTNVEPVNEQITTDSENTKISIEVSKDQPTNEPKMSIEQAKQSFIDSLSADVEKLEQSNTTELPNTEQYLKTSSEFNTFMTFLVGKLFIPQAIGLNGLSMNKFINAVTTYKYDSYDSPNISINHSLSEGVIYLKRLSKIFNFEFLSSVSAKWKFDDLDTKICSFLEQYNELQSTKLEYELVRSFLGKILISLSTTTEQAFREPKTPLINSQYKSVIDNDVKLMQKLKSDNKWFQSWQKFMDAFYGLTADNFIYYQTDYNKINETLHKCYETDFLTEVTVANCLKCYFPSISLNYFYIIKCVYLLSRMITVYVETIKDQPNIETIMNDINTIASVVTLIYENKNYIFKQTSHALPKSNSAVNEKTNMYILNHLFTGGQYYLLKMLERSVPVVANMIVDLRQQK